MEFDLNELLSILSQRQGRFNIRASQAWGSLYVLDLAETYKFLKNLSDCNGNSRSNFLDFVDRRIIESKDKSKNWLTCVKDCDPMNHVYVSKPSPPPFPPFSLSPVHGHPLATITNMPVDSPLTVEQHAQPSQLQLRPSRWWRRRATNGHPE